MKKFTIEYMNKLAELQDGKCLSRTYCGTHKKLKWECSKEHTWRALPMHVQRGHWCPYCAGNAPKNIEHMNKLAELKKGKCLSRTYCGTHKKLKWQCSKGHTWMGSPAHVQKGHWCPFCAGQRVDLLHLNKLISNSGGKLLSKKYINSRSKLKIKCQNGHVFMISRYCLLRNHWCSMCTGLVKEESCRFIFQHLTGKKFPKNRRILNGLELDGYCEEMGLAFEYDGEQHFKYMKHWHKNQSNFKKQIKRDRDKTLLCNQNKIQLIRVPYKEQDNLDRHIKQCLNKLKIKYTDTPVDWRCFWKNNSKKLIELNEFAKNKGGKCLSKCYLNGKDKLKWECSKGHQWEATSDSMINRKFWCLMCCGWQRNIEDMQKLAHKKGGRCLSTKYLGIKRKLEWECSKGHQWEFIPDSIISKKSWCPKCAGNAKLDREQIKKLYISGMKKASIAKQLKCSSTAVGNILNHELKIQ